MGETQRLHESDGRSHSPARGYGCLGRLLKNAVYRHRLLEGVQYFLRNHLDSAPIRLNDKVCDFAIHRFSQCHQLREYFFPVSTLQHWAFPSSLSTFKLLSHRRVQIDYKSTGAQPAAAGLVYNRATSGCQHDAVLQ